MADINDIACTPETINGVHTGKEISKYPKDTSSILSDII